MGLEILIVLTRFMLLLNLSMVLTSATTNALFLVLALLAVFRSNTACTDQERQILLTFLGSLSTPLQSWNTTVRPDCCQWEGIACHRSSSVTEISLPSKSLTGEISPVLSNLTSLSYLNLSHNSLSGSFPVELLSLSTSLKFLDVSFNELSGVMSDFRNPVIRVLDISSNFFNGLLPIINSTSLLLLNATNNSFMGPIPDYLCTNSPFLIKLDISYNKFAGKISPKLRNCTALRDFHAGSNNLVGSLPDELFELTSLQNLDLSANNIDGSLNGALIPLLQNLVSLNLGTNFLTGSIPQAISHLKRLQSLDLSSNTLTGMLPSSIENISDLRELNLRENKLTGNLQHINFTKLADLELLDLYNNSFTGEIPKSIFTCKNLNSLRLSRNKFKGQIPPQVENLSALYFLSLSSNNFVNITGALENLSKCKNLTALLISGSFFGEALPIEPTWENGFENIQILSMALNNFTGKIPSWISKLTKLEILQLTGNRFTGQIPDWIGNLSSLFFLDLSVNFFSGNIPPSITHLPSLNSLQKLKRVNPTYLILPTYGYNILFQYNQLTAYRPTINLANNQLNGTIPKDIGQLAMLLALDLSGNNLSGPIPDSVGNLSNLEALDLSRNELTSLIPDSLAHLYFLSTFSVAYNNLSGPVPTGGQFNTFLNSSYEGNSNLCGPVVMRTCSDPSNEENKTPAASESNTGIVIATGLGFFIGFVAVVVQQFYQDFMKAWVLYY